MDRCAHWSNVWDAIQDFHIENTWASITVYRKNSGEALEELEHFAVFEVSDGTEILSRVLSSGIRKRGSVAHGNTGTYKWAQEKLGWPDPLDEVSWLGLDEGHEN